MSATARAFMAGRLADTLTRVFHAYEAEIYEQTQNERKTPASWRKAEVPFRGEVLSLLKEFDETVTIQEETRMTVTAELPKQELKIPPGRFVSVYITSKRIHADYLLSLRQEWPHLYFTARWPVVRNIPTEQNRPAAHWLQDNVGDMERAEVVVLLAHPDDDLSGSIFEAGIAWGMGKTIYLVGENRSYKEWKFAARIRRHPTMALALEEITRSIAYRPSDSDRIMEGIRGLSETVREEAEGLHLALKDPKP
jgi:nucleoside 2-deoxyribosyltransferase